MLGVFTSGLSAHPARSLTFHGGNVQLEQIEVRMPEVKKWIGTLPKDFTFLFAMLQ